MRGAWVEFKFTIHISILFHWTDLLYIVWFEKTVLIFKDFLLKEI